MHLVVDFQIHFNHFFACVYNDIKQGYVGDTISYPTFYDGYQNATICNAIYESATQAGMWVKIEE